MNKLELIILKLAWLEYNLKWKENKGKILQNYKPNSQKLQTIPCNSQTSKTQTLLCTRKYTLLQVYASSFSKADRSHSWWVPPTSVFSPFSQLQILLAGFLPLIQFHPQPYCLSFPKTNQKKSIKKKKNQKSN